MSDIQSDTKPAPITKRDMAERGLEVINRDKAGAVQISGLAGGVMFADALQVMEFGKILAVSQQAIPPAFRNNPGMCVAVCFLAVEWRMSPLAVINKSYIVNDRIAFESQLVHAIIESRAPLQKRLDCSYDGEGPTRTCTVIGMFTDGETRTYTTPMFRDIRIKNSPLWVGDPDQQLWYFASRSWARKWCPDVLLGIYSKEELQEDPMLGRDDDGGASPGLHARLAGTKPSDEGHQPGHAATQLDELHNVAAGGGRIIDATAEPAAAQQPDPEKDGGAKRRKKKADVAAGDGGTAMASDTTNSNGGPGSSGTTEPKTAAEYWPHAIRWIDVESLTRDDAWARWEGEREMRDAMKVTIPNRNLLEDRISARFPEAK